MAAQIKEGMTGGQVADIIEQNFENLEDKFQQLSDQFDHTKEDLEIALDKFQSDLDDAQSRMFYTPDNEDLWTKNTLLQFSDREYNLDRFSGKGYVILRKNIVCNTNTKVSNNILTQDMINKDNTIYEIRYDFDLDGNTITIPENCVLLFKEGTISNGTVILKNTRVQPNGYDVTQWIKANISGNYKAGQSRFDESSKQPQWWDGTKWIVVSSKDEITNVINQKLEDYYTSEEIDNKFNSYYTNSEVDDILNNYVTKEDYNNTLNNYYNKSQIDSKLDQYVTEDTFNSTLSNYYNKSEIDNKLNNYVTTSAFNSFKEEINNRLNQLEQAGIDLDAIQTAINSGCGADLPMPSVNSNKISLPVWVGTIDEYTSITPKANITYNIIDE